MNADGKAPQPSVPRPSPPTQNEANIVESNTVPSPPARAAAEAAGGIGTNTNAFFATPTKDDASTNVPMGNRTGNSAAPAVQDRPTGINEGAGDRDPAGVGSGAVEMMSKLGW